MEKDLRAREEAGLPLRLAMKRRRRRSDDGGSDEQRSDNVDDNGGDGGEAAVSSDPRLLAFDLSPRHELSMAARIPLGVEGEGDGGGHSLRPAHPLRVVGREG